MIVKYQLGLDSKVALEVMQSVQSLSQQNRTIICTIHQPSASIFHLFDKILLLANGRIIYSGSASKVMPYFSSAPFNFCLNIENGENPADLVISIAASSTKNANGVILTAEKLLELYEISENFVEANNQIANVLLHYATASSSLNTECETIRASVLHQIKVLCYRRIVCALKDPAPFLFIFLRYKRIIIAKLI
jgi:ABC-type multidrug transport system ATPase subunit